ncbi:MAG: PEPxxWA-CTERM sorting domain-containing protein [Burkholderiales bacterium]
MSPYAGWIAQTVTTPVPEADTWAMLLAGVGMVGWAARRRCRS